MAAMRILPRADFEAALAEHKFVKIKAISDHHDLWLHTPTNKNFTITNAQDVPDAILDEYLQEVNELYTTETPKDCENRTYTVNHKGDIKPHLDIVKQ